MRPHSTLSVLLAGALVWIGCGEAESPLPRLGFDSSTMFRFGEAQKSVSWDDHQDELFVRTVKFGRKLRSPLPIEVPEPLRMEYSAFRTGDDHDCAIELYAIEDGGGKETLLGSHEPLRYDPQALVGPQRFPVLANRQVLDLTPFAGRTIRLEWRVVHKAASHPSWIAMPRLISATPAQLSRPHVLLTCSDTHRYDHAFGEVGRQLMPELQSLAVESTVFSRAYSQSSWTLPSVTSVLTGLPPRYHRTGELLESGPLEDWDEGRKLEPGRFRSAWNGTYYVFGAYPSDLKTLPELLRQAGYQTALITTNHLYGVSGLSADGPDLVYNVGGVPGEMVNEAARRIMDLLDPSQPTFLLVHYMDAHEHQKWFPEEVPEADGRQGLLARKRLRYANRVEDTDRYLARLVEDWSDVFDRRSTMMAFYSDHGEDLGETEGLLGHGMSMSEEVLHVPLLIRFPDEMQIAPKVVEQTVAVSDLYPTVLEVAGVPLPYAMPGSTLVSVSSERQPVFADYQLYGKRLSSVRSSTDKLVINLQDGERQMEHLALSTRTEEELRRVARSLNRAFESYRTDAEAFSGDLKSQQRVDMEEAERRLQALGYAN